MLSWLGNYLGIVLIFIFIGGCVGDNCSSPRSTAEAFLDACKKSDDEKIREHYLVAAYPLLLSYEILSEKESVTALCRDYGAFKDAYSPHSPERAGEYAKSMEATSAKYQALVNEQKRLFDTMVEFKVMIRRSNDDKVKMSEVVKTLASKYPQLISPDDTLDQSITSAENNYTILSQELREKIAVTKEQLDLDSKKYLNETRKLIEDLEWLIPKIDSRSKQIIQRDKLKMEPEDIIYDLPKIKPLIDKIDELVSPIQFIRKVFIVQAEIQSKGNTRLTKRIELHLIRAKSGNIDTCWKVALLKDMK